MLILFQVIAVALVLLIAFLRPQLGYKWFRATWRGVGRIARHQALSVVLIGLLAIAINVGVSLLTRIPEPRVHDEFSYLLAADTFARGRLTNPTHPLWVHFESYHIIHQPTYQSKYPPAQGLMLAAGQVIGGHPIVGVWISVGLMGAAICWMLQAWLPPRWALLGGFLLALHPGILDWGQSYWGGAVAVIGGALVFGALRRIVRRPRMRDALLMGVGLAILANSRPYEGLIASLPVAVTILVWMIGKNGPGLHISITRVVLPILLILIPAAAWMGYYNFRVTGDSLRIPYQVYNASYSIAPNFIWQDPWRVPSYRHKVMRDYYMDTEGLKGQMRLHPVSGFIKETMSWVKRLWKFYFGLLLTVPLIMLPWVLRDRWMRLALLTCGVLAMAFLLHNWVLPHYAAPVTGLFLVIVLHAMRHLCVWRWRGKRAGRFIVQAIPVICAASLILASVEKAEAKPDTRARIREQLKKNGGPHLVLVRYGPIPAWHNEWVYNEADIDNAEVVWAREMDAARNRKLLEYFTDRQPWLMEVNGNEAPLKLLPYSAG